MLAQTKERAFNHAVPTSSRRENVSSEKGSKGAQSVEFDTRLISRLADKQYS